PVYSYRTRDGGAFSLFTATVDIQTTAAPGAAITPAQQLFDLMPGQRYQSESLKGIDLVGLNVPPAKSPALATSPAEYSGIISATGVPACLTESPQRRRLLVLRMATTADDSPSGHR